MRPDLEDSSCEPGVVLVVLPAEQVPHPEVVDDVRGDGGGVLGGGGGGGRPPNHVRQGEDCFFMDGTWYGYWAFHGERIMVASFVVD